MQRLRFEMWLSWSVLAWRVRGLRFSPQHLQNQNQTSAKPLKEKKKNEITITKTICILAVKTYPKGHVLI